MQNIAMETSKIGRKQISPPTGDSSVTQNRVPKSIMTPSDEFRSEKGKGGKTFFMAKGSSDLKWQRAKMLVGALEVKSYPFLQPKEDTKPLYKHDDGATKSKFEDALQAWQDLKLRKSFTKACANLPDSSCCCGLIAHSDNASTIKQYVTLLNEGWVKHANNKIKTRGFKIDAFLWNSQNSPGGGKPTTNILLIRFFELSTYKFMRCASAGSLDLDDMLLEDHE